MPEKSYQFITIFGIIIICLPHLFLYYLTDYSLLDSYAIVDKILNNKLIVLIILFTIIGLIIFIIGIALWMKEERVLKNAKNNKRKGKVKAYMSDSKNVKESKNNIDNIKNVEMEENEFYNYIIEAIDKKDYTVKRNVKISGASITIFDIVALSNDNKKPDKIFEIRKGKCDEEYINKIVAVVKEYLILYKGYYNRDCEGEVSLIVQDEVEKNKINILTKELFNKNNIQKININTYLLNNRQIKY